MDSPQQPQDAPSQKGASPKHASQKGSAYTDEWSPMEVQVDLRKAVLGGALAAMVSIVGSWAVGRVHGSEGLVLLETIIPTTRFLCSSVMTASATMLALMLTLLGLSTGASERFHPAHYKRVRQIALVDAIAFVAATVFLLLLGIPLEESDNLKVSWYSTAYYIVLVASSLLGGLLITAVLMLYDALRDIIRVFGLKGEDDPILETDSAQQSKA